MSETPQEYLEEISELPLPQVKIRDLEEVEIEEHTFYFHPN